MKFRIVAQTFCATIYIYMHSHAKFLRDYGIKVYICVYNIHCLRGDSLKAGVISEETGQPVKNSDGSRTIRVKEATILRLLKHGVMHESFDSLINRILDGFEKKGR